MQNVIERTVVLPENQSYIIRKIELKNNRGIIHYHSNKYELNFIIDAVGRRFVAGNISNFSAGDLLFMAPGVPHCWEIDNKEDNPMAITIHFKEEFFEMLLAHIPEMAFLNEMLKKSAHGLHLKSADNLKLMKLFSGIMNGVSVFKNFIKVLKLLKFISQIKDIEILEIAGFNWNVDLPQNHRLKKIYEYVFLNFKDSIRLNDVASIVGLTEGAFCAFFKKSTKKTFSNFIKEVRIGYACKLLGDNNDMSITQICFESGYNCLANFNRQFREITGMSPKEFRQKLAV